MFCLGFKFRLNSCLLLLLLLAHSVWADVVVQLNINRPIYDVSDKFISFTLKPDDLYKALDGSNRKTITRMASMLSHAHVKFLGDYYFATKTNSIRLRNPTKIIWKGFNKWTRAVNWTMIIPVPYKPNDWDPMETLTILNTSQMVGIDEAIWQFGNNFGSSRASDYVSELKTFNIMVESFRTSKMNWQTMGADISAGSSPDETRRYVDMSRDLNVAYGWIQPETFLSNSLDSPLAEHDPALRVLLKQNVPVWLSLPKKKTILARLDADDVMEGLNWAQTMGDAANVGFETIFKPMSLEDFEMPKYDFYVTALFKKIMGSRVYPARPLGLFGRPNKLYTHCANMVSGGLAFMVVNKNEQALQIAVRPMSRLQDTEVWQYALTMTNGQVMLNNKVVSVNSTLIPEIRHKPNKSVLQLTTPGWSVSFWVLPNANLEHCHFTEVETKIVPNGEDDHNIKRYSASDRLLKELIKESAKPSYTPLAGLFRRQRRSLDNEDRFKRFVLKGSKQEQNPLATNFAENIMGDVRSPLKRDIFSPERRIAALQWLSNIFKEPLNFELPALKRNARQSNRYGGPFFMTRDGKKTTFTKKITEIRKPERKKIPKNHKEQQEFDEEKFFKNVDEQAEPEYVRIPEGDVYLTNIASVDGADNEEVLRIETERQKAIEPVSEMKPLRLLPTEFFETLPATPIEPVITPVLNIGTALNNLLFIDPFTKSNGHFNNKNYLSSDVAQIETHKDQDIVIDAGGHNEADDFVQAQIDISQTALNHENQDHKIEEENEQQAESPHSNAEALLDATEPKTQANTQYFSANFLNTHESNVFDDSSMAATNSEDQVEDHDAGQTKSDEIPWWELSSKKTKRSLDLRYPSNSWRNNIIPKDGELLAVSNELSPLRLNQFEQKVNEAVGNTDAATKNNTDAEESIAAKLVNTLKAKVIKLMDIVTQHVGEFYNTLTRHLETSGDEISTTQSNRVS